LKQFSANSRNNAGINQIAFMLEFIKSVQNLFTPVLKLVGAAANNGDSLFKRKTRAPFNPRISGFHLNQGM
jgi:hypothetical protein